MDTLIYANLIDLCAISMLLLSIFAIASSRMRRLSQMFSVHSLLLAIVAFIVAVYTGNSHILIICILTLLLKAVAIPKFLNYTITKIETGNEIEPLIGIPRSLLLSSALVLIAYIITEPLLESIATIGRNCLAISLSIVFIGMLMMVTRKKALTEAVGLLMMENGLFLGAMTISYGMPLIVEFGVFFDVIIAVVILGIFSYRINRTFNSIDTSFMRRLKE